MQRSSNDRKNQSIQKSEVKIILLKIKILLSIISQTSIIICMSPLAGQAEKRIFFLGAQTGDKSFLQTNRVFLC